MLKKSHSSKLEQIDDMDVRYFTLARSEMELFQRIFDKPTAEMIKRYQQQSEPIKAYNRRKIENPKRIQTEQLIATYKKRTSKSVS